MSEINYVYLKDICTVNQGLQIPISERFHEDGPNRYFYITVQFLKVGHLDKFYIENPPKSTICNEDDIIIVRTGSTGQILTGIRGCFHNNFFKVNYDREKVVGKYLYYCLKTDEKQKEMKNRAGITTIPDLNHFMFLDMKIPLPNLIYQKWAADLLDIISQKIELNNKINAEFEAMAKLIYDYWFVQFDFPHEFKTITTDKNGRRTERVEVKPYKSSGGKMVWNEELKRETPAGWEDGTLGSYCPSTGGFAFKSSWWGDEGVSVVKIKDIKEDYTIDVSDLSKVDLSDRNVDEKFKAKAGNVLIAMTGATVGKYAIVPFSDNPIYVNQRVGYFNLGNEPFDRLPFLINSLNQKYFREVIFVLASGAAQPNISNEQINNIQLVIPNEKVVDSYNQKMSFFYKRILNNQRENQKLAELRDWLLPMLMNGQVKVSSQEEILNIAAEPEVKYGNE